MHLNEQGPCLILMPLNTLRHKITIPCDPSLPLRHLGGRQTETEQTGGKIQHCAQGHSAWELKALQCPEPPFSFTDFCVCCEAGSSPSSVD